MAKYTFSQGSGCSRQTRSEKGSCEAQQEGGSWGDLSTAPISTALKKRPMSRQMESSTNTLAYVRGKQVPFLSSSPPHTAAKRL